VCVCVVICDCQVSSIYLMRTSESDLIKGSMKKRMFVEHMICDDPHTTKF